MVSGRIPNILQCFQFLSLTLILCSLLFLINLLIYFILLAVWVVGIVACIFCFICCYMYYVISILACYIGLDIILFLYLLFEVVDYNSDLVILFIFIFPS